MTKFGGCRWRHDVVEEIVRETWPVRHRLEPAMFTLDEFEVACGAVRHALALLISLTMVVAIAA